MGERERLADEMRAHGYVTIAEAARVVRRSRTTIYGWLGNGVLAAYTDGLAWVHLESVRLRAERKRG